MELLLLRHSSTQGNLLHQYVGSQDHPLASEGVELARTRRAQIPAVDKLWVSPMMRCRQTAELLFPGMKQHPVADLRECDFGAFEGRSWSELSDDPIYQAWMAGDPTIIFPGGEKLGDHIRRCQRGVAEVVAQAESEGVGRAGILAHGGTLMSAMSGFAIPHHDFFSWLPQNCGGYLCDVKQNPFTLILRAEV